MRANEIIHADGHVGPIETLEQAKRALFNAAYRGLRWQGFQRCLAEGSSTACATRSVQPDGRVFACALGWAAPDDRVGPTQVTPPSDEQLAEPLSDWLTRRAAPRDVTLFWRFATRLQSAHDRSPVPNGMRASLESVGRQHDIPVPA